MISEFDSHWMPYTSDLVSNKVKLSKGCLLKETLFKVQSIVCVGI